MELMLSIFTKALGWAMLHSMWQGAAVYAIVGLLYLSFPRQLAKYKFWLAFGSQVTLLTLFLGTFIYYINIPALLMPSAELNAYLAIGPIGPIVPIIAESPSYVQGIELLFPWFTAIYTVGLLIQLVIFSNSYTRLSYLRRNGLSEAPVEWVHSFQEMSNLLKISRKVGFYLSDKISIPLTVGHFKPLVLFPVALVNQLEMQQVEAILLHELAHIKRNDYFVNLVSVLIETILFFNPFVWLLTKYIQQEREYACDDVVVEKLGSPISYAQALLSLETIKEMNKQPYIMAATGNKHHLLQRIKRITKMEKNYIHVKQHLFALAISTLAFAAIAWVAPDGATNEKKDNVVIDTLINDELADTLAFAAAADTIQDFLFIDTSNVNRLSPQKRADIVRYYNSPEWKAKVAKIEADAKKVEAYYNSPEWKEKIAKIEQDARKVEVYYNSPEWKEKVKKIEADARKVEAHYNSPEWKEKVAKIEQDARKVEVYYNSPEWKEKVEKIEQDARKIEAHYNSPEWKQKVEKMKTEAKKLEVHYNSPEWKEKVEKMKTEAKKLEVHYNSPEWKEKIGSIAKTASKAGEQFMDSPAWKEQVADFQNHVNNAEFKEHIQALVETTVNLSVDLFKHMDFLAQANSKTTVTVTTPVAATKAAATVRPNR